ncbi:MAG TPA: class I SAM-dependent methyltransferase [Stellaceae bacterium]|nr:class I SAM-dependent methyltransferase [Stellaceae bacterium]
MDMEERRVIFSWNKEEALELLGSCDDDGVFPIVQKHVPHGALVLESGCGLGRYVRYLNDRGFPCVGLEYRGETVRAIKDVWPDLAVVQGDVSLSPFPDGTFDAVISLGVVEHFVDGPGQALREMQRVLKPGGKAIITVPCLNTVRRAKRRVGWNEVADLPRALAARLLKGKPKPPTRFNRHYKYAVYPTYGPFFEYRMTREQFASEVSGAGFRIETHDPHALLDGVYHELNPFGLLIGFRNWKFRPSACANWLHARLARRPFFSTHMQVIVATKAVGVERR